VTTYMPMTGGRQDIGITTAANTAWLISQDPRAAAYALGQAEASGAVPWNFWDAANGTWLNTDNYPRLWTDGRGGTGTPGDPNSTGLTQKVPTDTGWTPDRAHQPDLSFVPYLLTGERAILDGVFAQASFSVMNFWPVPRFEGEGIVVNGGQVRSSAWSLRQIDNAAWAAPEGSAEQAYFQALSEANWKWLVAQIPAWTAMQGEAHGWVPGAYGTAGNLAPWQQDYFAAITIAAASRGNADALTFLEWQSNFLIGRFQQAANGFAPHDGAAYNIAIAPESGGAPFKTWAEIGAATVARGLSNGDGWSNSIGEYARLAGATLAGIHLLTGSAEALAAYKALVADSAPGMTTGVYAANPQYAVAVPGFYSGTIRGTEGDDLAHPVSGGMTLDIDLGAGFDEMRLGAGNNAGRVRNVELLIGSAGNDAITIEGAAGGTFVDLGAGADTLTLAGGGRVTVVNAERVLGGALDDDLVLGDVLTAAAVVDLGGGLDRVQLALGGNVAVLRNVETVLGASGADDVQLGTGLMDGLVDLGAGEDVLRLANQQNRLLLIGVETVLGSSSADEIRFGAPLSGAVVDLGGGSDVLRLADGANTVTVANVETVLGGAGADAVVVTAAATNSLFDLGAGADTLRLATASAVSVQVARAETVLGGAANETVTLRAQMLDGTVSLGGGADVLQLGDWLNRVLVGDVETVRGGVERDVVTLQTAALPGMLVDLGAGSDVLRLGVFDNVLTVRNVETLFGAGRSDAVTLATAALPGTMVNLGAGQDRLVLTAGGNTLTAWYVETVIGSWGADDVTFGAATLLPSHVDLGGGSDVLRLADGANTVTVANVETVLGGAGADRITVAGGTPARVEAGAGADTITGGLGADRILGGAGADVLSGGAGADWFIFRGAADSPLAAPDRILDFSLSGGDRLMLEGMGITSLAYLGAAPFAAAGGAQVRFVETASRLDFDLDGDGAADMAITLEGVTTEGLSGAAFILG
jgi:Ca2+-binding RTX toxin-like protein